MGEVINIKARDIRCYDVWLGDENVELEVHIVRPLEGQTFIPWNAGRTTPPIPMLAIEIHGELTVPGREPYVGAWTLQEDMPIEVRRGA